MDYLWIIIEDNPLLNKL